MDKPRSPRHAAFRPSARGPAARDDAKAVYELKVTLRDTSPPIWRRVQVRADITLFQLHDVLQVAMGWTDNHMHGFEAGGISYGRPDAGSPDREDERKIRLDAVLRKPGARLVYVYDFGDSWEHLLVLEKKLPAEPGMLYPFVLAGKGACPPEDCGGAGGYYRFLEAIRNPSHREHADMVEWIGGKFDPDKFSAQSKNRMFHGGWGRSDEDA